MKLQRVAAFVLSAFGLATNVENAHADTPPSRWERAKAPAVGQAYDLHVQIQRMIAQAYERRDVDAMMGARAQSEMREGFLRRVLAFCDAREVAKMNVSTLQFDLGDIYAKLGRDREAVQALERGFAIAEKLPASQRSTSAELEARRDLAYAYAKTDRPADEREAYITFIASSTNELSRATAQLNLAEAEMRLGNLNEAIPQYRDVIDLCGRIERDGNALETEALAHYGLAVALDRRGDRSGSERALAAALAIDRQFQLISPENERVFFVPAYEREWYLALATTSFAASTANEAPGVSAKFRRLAHDHWAAYVRAAHSDDRWLPQAKRHLVAAKRALAAGAK